jgi:hypothetical protein
MNNNTRSKSNIMKRKREVKGNAEKEKKHRGSRETIKDVENTKSMNI